MTLKSLDSYPLGPPLPPPYRLPIQTSNSGTMTSSSSGIYDEIHTVASQYGSQPGPANHHYQEIPADSNDTSGANAPPDSDSCPRDSALGGEIETPQPLSSETPYNLPDQPDSTHMSTVNPQFLQSSDVVDVSEGTISPPQQEPSTITEQTDAQSCIADSSEFTNNNLQVTPPPEDIKNSSTSSGRSTAMLQLEPKPAAPHVDIVIEPTIEESIAVKTLPMIPEHPYHVLEEQQVRDDQLPTTSENDSSFESSVELAPPPKILPRLSLSEDEGYDRLVGPPHIYHILHKSPSLPRPQVRECSPSSGYHHLTHTMENGDQVHSPLPLPDDLLYSEENSTISGSELFDDPMYNCSPKRAFKGAPPTPHNSHNGTLETTKREKPIDLAKYRGDYERDPTYMKFIREASKQRNEPAEESDHTDVAPLMKDTLSSIKSTSLPDITTRPMYQSLQTLTRDPLRNYEMLHKRQLTVNAANA